MDFPGREDKISPIDLSFRTNVRNLNGIYKQKRQDLSGVAVRDDSIEVPGKISPIVYTPLRGSRDDRDMFFADKRLWGRLR